MVYLYGNSNNNENEGDGIDNKATTENAVVTLEQSEVDQQIYAMKIMWKSQVIRDRALQQVKDEVIRLYFL
jgi:hypothetical protein